MCLHWNVFINLGNALDNKQKLDIESGRVFWCQNQVHLLELKLQIFVMFSFSSQK